jgi:hypothetical protein
MDNCDQASVLSGSSAVPAFFVNATMLASHLILLLQMELLCPNLMGVPFVKNQQCSICVCKMGLRTVLEMNWTLPHLQGVQKTNKLIYDPLAMNSNCRD